MQFRTERGQIKVFLTVLTRWENVKSDARSRATRCRLQRAERPNFNSFPISQSQR